MKTEQELINYYYGHGDWKSLKLWSWVHEYGKEAVEWNNIFPPVTDDRRVFINTFHQVYEAVDSMHDNHPAWVCVAINEKMHKDEEMMTRIISHFKSIQRGM